MDCMHVPAILNVKQFKKWSIFITFSKQFFAITVNRNYVLEAYLQHLPFSESSANHSINHLLLCLEPHGLSLKLQLSNFNISIVMLSMAFLWHHRLLETFVRWFKILTLLPIKKVINKQSDQIFLYKKRNVLPINFIVFIKNSDACLACYYIYNTYYMLCDVIIYVYTITIYYITY